MALPPLVTPADLATALGFETDLLGARGQQVCELVSAAVRNHVRKPITRVVDDVAIVPLEGVRLHLPSWPVEAVSAVEVDGALVAAGARRWTVRGEVYLTSWREDGWSGVWTREARVTYTHGHAEVPEDVRLAALSAAARAWRNAAGARSESIGNYSVTYGDATPSGSSPGAMLSVGEQLVLDAHRAY